MSTCSWWTLHASEHCASEGAQKFALTVNPNLDEVISDQCRPGQQHHIATASGRKACAVPLWLEGDVVRLPTGFVGRTREHLTSLQARLPFGAVLTIGVLLGISISPPLRRLKRWLKTGEG